MAYLDGVAQQLLGVSGLDQGPIIRDTLIMVASNLGS